MEYLGIWVSLKSFQALFISLNFLGEFQLESREIHLISFGKRPPPI